MTDKTLDQIAADFKALPPEDRRAVSDLVKRLVERQSPGETPEQHRADLLAAAGETGNARLVDAAEKVVGQH